jgi:DNA mismatch endonuclease, patch repair protein
VPNAISKPQQTTFGGLSRSELMSRVRSRNNATTELRMLQMLRQAGLTGWRRHLALPGRPDFSWPRKQIALFVHGCFWHGHDCGRNLQPKSNSAAWQAKIARNQIRDIRSARLLRQSGWSVITIWECRLHKRPDACVRRIARHFSGQQKGMTVQRRRDDLSYQRKRPGASVQSQRS